METSSDLKRYFSAFVTALLVATPIILTFAYLENENIILKWVILILAAAVSFQFGKLFRGHIDVKRSDWQTLEKVLDIIFSIFLLGCGAGLMYVYGYCLEEIFRMGQGFGMLSISIIMLIGAFWPAKVKSVKLTKNVSLKLIGDIPDLDKTEE